MKTEEETRCEIISTQFTILRNMDFDKYSEASRAFDDARFGLTTQNLNKESKDE